MPLTCGDTVALIVQRLPVLGRALRSEARLGELDLDSLDQVELMMVVDELFGIRLEIEDLEPERTVGDLAARITARTAEVHQP
jgi:acyl carrier protein